jgi:hypothetical protein
MTWASFAGLRFGVTSGGLAETLARQTSCTDRCACGRSGGDAHLRDDPRHGNKGVRVSRDTSLDS